MADPHPYPSRAEAVQAFNEAYRQLSRDSKNVTRDALAVLHRLQRTYHAEIRTAESTPFVSFCQWAAFLDRTRLRHLSELAHAPRHRRLQEDKMKIVARLCAPWGVSEWHLYLDFGAPIITSQRSLRALLFLARVPTIKDITGVLLLLDQQRKARATGKKSRTVAADTSIYVPADAVGAVAAAKLARSAGGSQQGLSVVVSANNGEASHGYKDGNGRRTGVEDNEETDRAESGATAELIENDARAEGEKHKDGSRGGLKEDGHDGRDINGMESDSSLDKDMYQDEDITDIESDAGLDEDERENGDVNGRKCSTAADADGDGDGSRASPDGDGDLNGRAIGDMVRVPSTDREALDPDIASTITFRRPNPRLKLQGPDQEDRIPTPAAHGREFPSPELPRSRPQELPADISDLGLNAAHDFHWEDLGNPISSSPFQFRLGRLGTTDNEDGGKEMQMVQMEHGHAERGAEDGHETQVVEDRQENDSDDGDGPMPASDESDSESTPTEIDPDSPVLQDEVLPDELTLNPNWGNGEKWPVDDVLVVNNGCNIRPKDVRRLDNNTWLNDEIVNFYLGWQREAFGRCEEVSLLLSFFFSSETNRAHRPLPCSRWILVPICENSHWYLGIIGNATFLGPYQGIEDSHRPFVLFVDSMQHYHQPSFIRLKTKLSREYNAPDDIEWIQNVHALQQPAENGVDCGIFLLEHAERFYQNPLGFVEAVSGAITPFSELTTADIARKRASIRNLLFSLKRDRDSMGAAKRKGEQQGNTPGSASTNPQSPLLPTPPLSIGSSKECPTPVAETSEPSNAPQPLLLNMAIDTQTSQAYLSLGSEAIHRESNGEKIRSNFAEPHFPLSVKECLDFFYQHSDTYQRIRTDIMPGSELPIRRADYDRVFTNKSVDTRGIKKFKESDMWESIADLQPPSPGSGESKLASSLKRKYKEFERDFLVYEQIVKYRSQRVEDVKAVSNLCQILEESHQQTHHIEELMRKSGQPPRSLEQMREDRARFGELIAYYSGDIDEKIRVEEARLAAMEREYSVAFQVASLAKRNSAVLKSCLLEDLKEVKKVEKGIEKVVEGDRKSVV